MNGFPSAASLPRLQGRSFISYSVVIGFILFTSSISGDNLKSLWANVCGLFSLFFSYLSVPEHQKDWESHQWHNSISDPLSQQDQRSSVPAGLVDDGLNSQQPWIRRLFTFFLLLSVCSRSCSASLLAFHLSQRSETQIDPRCVMAAWAESLSAIISAASLIHHCWCNREDVPSTCPPPQLQPSLHHL